MTILKEQLRRTIELMGILSEQDGKAVNVKPEEFVCDRCRWVGERIYQVTEDNKHTGEILLFLSLLNHTGSDTDRIERFDWEGNESNEHKAYDYLLGKALATNREYKLDIDVPKLNGFMESEKQSIYPPELFDPQDISDKERTMEQRRVGESTPFISKLKK